MEDCGFKRSFMAHACYISSLHVHVPVVCRKLREPSTIQVLRWIKKGAVAVSHAVGQASSCFDKLSCYSMNTWDFWPLFAKENYHVYSRKALKYSTNQHSPVYVFLYACEMTSKLMCTQIWTLWVLDLHSLKTLISPSPPLVTAACPAWRSSCRYNHCCADGSMQQLP